MRKRPQQAWEPDGKEETLLKTLWPDHTLEEVLDAFREAKFNRSRMSIERKARSMDLHKSSKGRERSYQYRQTDRVSALEKLDWLPTFDKFETVRSDCVAICSDMHIPYVDIELVKKMCGVAERMEAKDCILAGDTFNQDMFSQFIRYLEGGETSWTFELEAVSEVLKMILGTFQHVWVTRGNHDERILRLLMGKVGLKHIFKWVTPEVDKRVQVSEYPYCYLVSGETKIRITHPKSYSKIPTRVSSWLANKWECSIMSAHGHRQGLVGSDAGRWVADLGGMFNPKKIEYINLSDTVHGRWNPGFFIVRNGFPYMFSRDWTDWGYWLKG